MRTLKTIAELDSALGGAARPNAGAFVPTMGALHAGHAALIRRGAELGPCVVSIFVNPTQFNEPADFERYPRTLEADLAICASAGAAAVFAPGVDEVYPRGASAATVELPRVAVEPGLEDRHRPGHFAGVAQVVLRLLRIVRPSFAVFGEKDWQQLQLVRAIVESEGLPVRVEGFPTVRDADGLALSSRNRFLSVEERARAGAIPRALELAGKCGSALEAERAMAGVLESAGLSVEYGVVRDGATLGPLGPGSRGRALIAARAGGVRLIDNAPWAGSGDGVASGRRIG